MSPSRLTLCAISALALLSLAGCAGTPPAGTTKVAKKQCIHETGSFLCSSGDDQMLGNSNDPSFHQQGGLDAPSGR